MTAPDETASDGRGKNPHQGKGRPTPKRREAEAARRRPLVPHDRRAAAKQAREAARAAREREYQAMRTGDERFLPARDKGPVRRWVRDFIDARWTLGEFFLPIAMVVVVFSLFLPEQIAVLLMLGLYAVVLIAIVDAFVLSRILKKRLAERFGDAVPRGTVMYGIMRAFQIRRARLPRPQVKRGQHPE